MHYEGRFLVEVEPGVGVGPVRLGMLESDVLAALGEPEGRAPADDRSGATLYWYGNSLQVTLDAAGRAAEIMVCRGAPIPVLDGMDLLRTPADEVVARLSGLGNGRYDEEGFSYSFPQARLAFWRQGLPGDEWEPEEYDQFREGRFWDTVSTWAVGESAGVAAPGGMR